MEHLSFTQIETEDQAYWLGFIAADGCVTKHVGLKISLAEIDRDHLEKLADSLGVSVWGPYRGTQGGQYVTTTCARREIVGGLAIQGVHERKTWTIKPWNGPELLMRHYWRGVFDGDGWISGKEVGLVGNREMVEGFSRFTGFPIYQNKKAWRAQSGGYLRTQPALHILYDDATVYLERKKLKADELMSRVIKTRGTWSRKKSSARI